MLARDQHFRFDEARFGTNHASTQAFETRDRIVRRDRRDDALDMALHGGAIDLRLDGSSSRRGSEAHRPRP